LLDLRRPADPRDMRILHSGVVHNSGESGRSPAQAKTNTE